MATGSAHRLQIEARLFLWPHDAALIVAEVDGILTFSEQALWRNYPHDAERLHTLCCRATAHVARCCSLRCTGRDRGATVPHTLLYG